MSETKLAAAKELIQEKRYDEARVLLRTVNHPTATKWLAKLDNIDPPSRQTPRQDSQQERFYRRENQRANRRRIGDGLYLIVAGLVCFGLFAVNAMPKPALDASGGTIVNIGLGWLFIPVGILAIIGGIIKLRRRD
jgi:hypothetical protein